MNQKKRIKLETQFYNFLVEAGFNFASGVPCAVQKYIIKNLSHSPKIKHIPAVRESEAIGVAAGAYLAGKKPIIYMQNSGLMNSINDITSLLIPYKIPLLFSVTWRGTSGEDAPQHLINGKSTIKVLNVIGVPIYFLTKKNMKLVVKSAKKKIEEEQISVVILMTRKALI